MRMTDGRVRAITMWDFSWLERRWPGAGYENWDEALSGLVERGYDTVRIDAYPHLVHADPTKTWALPPRWTTQVWGAPALVHVQVVPQLTDFIAAASRHGVAVALSTWFRRDVDDTRMRIARPADVADAWISTLRVIEDAGLLDTIVYVDLTNEFPLPPWAPWFYGSDQGAGHLVAEPAMTAWMSESADRVRAAYPDLDVTYSFAESIQTLREADVSRLDLLEPHLWMAGVSDYYDRVGYDFEPFDPIGYDNLVTRGRRVYEGDQARYDEAIFSEIDRAADWSRATGKPLVTTECWSIVDYKDWPGLDWDWVQDLNERALVRAAATGRWVGLATSNFCGPQFVGMWRDVAYHQRLTKVIHEARLDDDLRARRG